MVEARGNEIMCQKEKPGDFAEFGAAFAVGLVVEGV